MWELFLTDNPRHLCAQPSALSSSNTFPHFSPYFNASINSPSKTMIEKGHVASTLYSLILIEFPQDGMYHSYKKLERISCTTVRPNASKYVLPSIAAPSSSKFTLSTASIIRSYLLPNQPNHYCMIRIRCNSVAKSHP